MLILQILVLVLVLFLIYVQLRPNDFRYERSRVIKASPEAVFEQVNEFRNWEKWSPWIEMEPTAKLTYGENTAGEGGYYRWDGKKTGAGSCTILRSAPNEAVDVALEFERTDVFDALVRDSRRSRNLKKIHAHAGGIESNGLKTRLLDHRAQRLDGQLAAINIRHIRAKNERRLLTTRDFLQMTRLAGRELNRIWSCFHNGFHRLRHVLDSCQKARLIKKAVIDGDIKAAAGFGVEETVEAVGFHM